MKARIDVYKDVSTIKIIDDMGAVVDQYETKDIIVKNYQYEKKYADPDGTLPIVPKTIQ